MQSSRLVKLLKILSPAEFRRFRKFLLSPFHTTNDKLLPFYKSLAKFHPNFNSPRMSRERVFEKAFPGVSFSAAGFNKLSFELAKLTEDYLLHLEIHEDDFRKRKMLTSIYGKRNLYEFFEKETKALLEYLEKTPYRDFEYYKAVSELNSDYYFHVLTEKHTLKDEAIAKLAESTDHKFALEKFRIASELKSRERILSKKYYNHFLPAILKEHERGFMSDNLSANLFGLSFKLFEKEEHEKAFYKLKEQFTAGYSELRGVSQALFFIQLINYSSSQINLGKHEFYKQALDLYKFGLETGLLIEDGKMSEAVFANIVTMGCHEKEFDRTKSFIDGYQKYLDKSVRLDLVTHSMGVWYFNQKDFENAFDQFANHTFSQAWQPSARCNLLRTLYELCFTDDDYYDLLMAQANTFERFLNRSELLADSVKESHLNFIFFIRKMIKIHQNRQNVKEKGHKLIAQISELGKVTGKDWLTEKIKKLDLVPVKM